MQRQPNKGLHKHFLLGRDNGFLGNIPDPTCLQAAAKPAPRALSHSGREGGGAFCPLPSTTPTVTLQWVWPAKEGKALWVIGHHQWSRQSHTTLRSPPGRVIFHLWAPGSVHMHVWWALACAQRYQARNGFQQQAVHGGAEDGSLITQHSMAAPHSHWKEVGCCPSQRTQLTFRAPRDRVCS